MLLFIPRMLALSQTNYYCYTCLMLTKWRFNDEPKVNANFKWKTFISFDFIKCLFWYHKLKTGWLENGRNAFLFHFIYFFWQQEKPLSSGQNVFHSTFESDSSSIIRREHVYCSYIFIHIHTYAYHWLLLMSFDLNSMRFSFKLNFITSDE